ncbi:hypothetical protein ACUXHY_005471 [Cytobacillus horneckiae]
MTTSSVSNHHAAISTILYNEKIRDLFVCAEEGKRS